MHAKNRYFCTKFKHFLLLMIVFFLAKTHIFAQQDLRYIDPKKQLTQYILEHWTSEKGLPSNNIRRLTTTQDGFLWLSGFDGLTNFEGVRFTNFNKKNTKSLQNNATYSISEAPNGTLWVATDGSGLYAYQKGKLEYKLYEKEFVGGVFAEENNKIWVSVRNKGLFIYNPETQEQQKINHEILANTLTFNIRKDKLGNYWFCTEGKGILKQDKNGEYTLYNKKNGLPSDNGIEIYLDTFGNIWAGTTKGCAVFNEKTKKFDFIKEIEDNAVYKILQDASGSHWFATSNGLYRKNAITKKIEQFPVSPERPVTNVNDIAFDKEGSLWIGTYRHGLFRLKEGKFTNYTYQDGLSTLAVGSICEVKKGVFWVGMNDGIINIIDQNQNNKITKYIPQTPLAEWRVYNINTDQEQNIWICTFRGLIKVTPQGQEFFFNEKNGLPDDGVRVMCDDKKGNIWVGTRREGVIKLDKFGKILKKFNKKNGLSSNFIMSLKEDAQGNMIVGTNDASINIIKPNEKIEIITGLEKKVIFSTHIDSQNTIWVATNEGIVIIKDKNVTLLGNKEGLFNDAIFDIVEDNNGQIWIPNSKGVIKILKKEIEDYIANPGSKPNNKLHWVIYDTHDGMKNEDCTGAAHSIIAQNGNIWIPTNGGLLVIDPKNIPINHLKPEIKINQLFVDGISIDIHQPKIYIKPNQRRYVFDYSALSLLASEKVRFKYKLEGFDDDWTDAGSIREAIYTNLPAGTYKFRVIGCNNDGVWNDVGDSITLVKEPHPLETWWAISLLIVLVATIIWLGVRWRLYTLHQRSIKLEQIVENKTKEISEKNNELEKQYKETHQLKELAEKRNDSIIQSINYAKRIQDAMLPDLAFITKNFKENFVFFQPRDIVSGDFYWFDTIDDKKIFSVADCTGHGVPGAFMSMIGNDCLNEIVQFRKITDTSEILASLHQHINYTLQQQDNLNRDGMDMVLCVWQEQTRMLQFSGAKNSLYYVTDNQFFELKGSKHPVGGLYKVQEKNREYEVHNVHLPNDTWVYLCSDGYQDQFSKENHKKFSRQKLRDLLFEIYKLSPEQQKEKLYQITMEWRGTEEQIDDILIMGIKL